MNALAGTGASTLLVAQIDGKLPSVTLAWGSASFPITVKTNAALGYRVTVRATSILNGFATTLKDVKVEVTKIRGVARSSATGSVACSTGKTTEQGDVYQVRVSVPLFLGSPMVKLSYDFVTYTK
ncbi:hypothetical protein UFOVP1189_16 [uncultured Caudovirales phage]|uniref:Uncharacterized protein n=3 Tax=uncultured Caudovirales phage TaxID=2100421 RepID=A0A6J5QZM0_9CAUD|nr:hypothetical protein UFOVP1189_16 [uncultured Caudovirales phage]